MFGSCRRHSIQMSGKQNPPYLGFKQGARSEEVFGCMGWVRITWLVLLQASRTNEALMAHLEDQGDIVISSLY